MTATETITSNPRVLGADPLVCYQEAKGKKGETDYQEEVVGGLGEEDLVTVTLPYINSAREGVIRLGQLLEKYGTYEKNGIAFSDVNEIWWLETIGGHHWIARRVPDDVYVTMPNQMGLDQFDLKDALGQQKNYMCSADLGDFIEENHLNLTMEGSINPRDAFGSKSDGDHVYNTPRAWILQKYFNPNCSVWDQPNPKFNPMSDDIPWCRTPEKKITIEDIKDALSNHYQGTPFDPYEHETTPFRPIGVSRTEELHILQIRPYMDEAYRSLQWISFGSNVYNQVIPMYTMTDASPSYVSCADGDVSTDSCYWTSRLIETMADPYHKLTQAAIESYQERVINLARQMLIESDKKLASTTGEEGLTIRREANEKMAQMLKKESVRCLNRVLFLSSTKMKNAFSRND